MIRTYTKDTIIFSYKGTTKSYAYKVLEKGDDYVVVRAFLPSQDYKDDKVRFESELKSFWAYSDTEFPELFTKIK